MPTSGPDFRAASLAFKMGRAWSAFVSLAEQLWLQEDPNVDGFYEPIDRTLPPCLPQAVRKLRASAARLKTCLPTSQEKLVARFTECLSDTWKALQQAFYSEEHLEQIRTRTDAEHDENYCEWLSQFNTRMLLTGHWSRVGWEDFKKVTAELVRNAPSPARAFFNASALLHQIRERSDVLVTPYLVDPLLTATVTTGPYDRFVSRSLNPLLAASFAEIAVALPPLGDLSSDLSLERYRERRRGEGDYLRWAKFKARSLARQIRTALDQECRTAFERTAPSASAAATPKTGAWYYGPDATRPDKFRFGPLVGSKTELTNSIVSPSKSGGCDPRTLERRCREGMYWAQREGGHQFVVYFQDDNAFRRCESALATIRVASAEPVASDAAAAQGVTAVVTPANPS